MDKIDVLWILLIFSVICMIILLGIHTNSVCELNCSTQADKELLDYDSYYAHHDGNPFNPHHYFYSFSPPP